MEQVTISTEAGDLELIPVTADELRGIAEQWPMGMVMSQEETELKGLVFQIGEEEAYGIKLQPPDTDEQSAQTLLGINQALIASALPFYLEHQHQGVMVPCAYYKEKAVGQIEAGFAFFVSPHPASKLAAKNRTEMLYDDQLGDGASKMIFDMATALPKASKLINLPVNTVIGIDFRPRLALGRLSMHFLVQGANVFAIQHPLRREHPVWAFAVRAGYSKLPYAPMVPAAVPGPSGDDQAWENRVKILTQRLGGVQS